MTALFTPQWRFDAASLVDLCSYYEALGYDGIWTGEVNNAEAVVPTAVAATATQRAEVAAVLNVFTRAPSTLAMTAAGLADLAPGRAAIILGVASPLLVSRYNGMAYERPLARLQDVTRFLRMAMEGGRVRGEFATFTTGGYGLIDKPVVPPKLYIASSGPRSMAFAAAHADGVVVNWTGPEELDRLPELPSDRSKVILQYMMCPSADTGAIETMMRPIIADYLCAPAYAGLQRRLGRGPAFAAMWAAFERGDRAGVHASLPADVIHHFVISGSPAQCRERIAAIERDAGCRMAIAPYPPPGVAFRDAIIDLKGSL